MFLDDQLRRIAAEKQRLTTRVELERQLVRLEWRLGKMALHRPFAGFSDGLEVASHLLRWLRRT